MVAHEVQAAEGGEGDVGVGAEVAFDTMYFHKVACNVGQDTEDLIHE